MEVSTTQLNPDPTVAQKMSKTMIVLWLVYVLKIIVTDSRAKRRRELTAIDLRPEDLLEQLLDDQDLNPQPDANHSTS